jgi:hypothetical protein
MDAQDFRIPWICEPSLPSEDLVDCCLIRAIREQPLELRKTIASVRLAYFEDTVDTAGEGSRIFSKFLTVSTRGVEQ